jgi:hypothetical protein
MLCDDSPDNLLDDEELELVKRVTGKAYRELCTWIKSKDFNLTSLVMRKTRDAKGVVGWVAPQHASAWVLFIVL